MTQTEIRAILAARGLAPLKQLGQNFLHDQNLAAWLTDRAVGDLPSGATIVEIGPGLGALTELLLRRGMHVIALEKDRGLCLFLREKFQAEIADDQLDLREGDALALLSALETGPPVICGNLPYYISTPLLMECLRLPGTARLFFLMQKEVAQRLAGGPGTKTYGSLSVQVQAAYQVALLRTLPGSVFYPPPEIASAAVQLTPLARPLVSSDERARFSAIVQRGFSQRRKKLSNLLPTGDGRRAEHLSPAEWVTLWREIESKSSPST
jgi:16S rRNA (adenine1518-N6/adenine1519-N6)-dimethyltransferase